MTIGIGGEIVWICPTLSSTNGVDDLSGNGNDGTLVDATIVSDTGSDGTHAIEISGETNRVEIGRPAEVISSPNDFSLSAWVYADTLGTGATSHTIWGGYVGLAGNELWSMLRVDDGDLKYWYSNSSGGYTSKTGPSISTGAWTHVAITIDSSNNIKFYVNGTLGSTQTLVTPSSSPHSTVEWWIGQSQAGLSQAAYDEAFDGKIDDFRWFDKVLTDDEVGMLATKRGFDIPAGLGDEVLWVCPSISDSPYDLSLNSNHGTYVGGMGTVAETSHGGVRAYSFDATDDFINFGDILDTEVWSAGDFSISGWMKTNASRSRMVLFGKYALIPRSFYLGFGTSRGKVTLDLIMYSHEPVTNNVYHLYRILDNTTIAADTWYHLVMSYDADGNGSYGKATFWLNGVQATPISEALQQIHLWTAIEDNSEPLGMGSTSSDGTTPYFIGGGLIDDARVYDRQLTSGEAWYLYQSRGVLGAPPPLSNHPFNSINHVLD